ncbi:hypothetical protein GZ976_002735 [Clostridium perfringens]|nr:hypothetical protein [Clostridium perfringens]
MSKNSVELDNLKGLSLDNFIKKTEGMSYTERALLWFKLNLNKKVTSSDLAKIPGKKGNPISHNMRRIFELRDEKGYDIVNWKDNERTNLNLKVDEWVLLSTEPIKENIRSRGVNKRITFEVFSRDSFTCQTCGRTPKDDDPFKPGHKVTLHVGHIIAHKSNHNKNNKELTADDFITMCNVCNEGAKNNEIPIITLLDRVKASSDEEKQTVYDYLKNSFDKK